MSSAGTHALRARRSSEANCHRPGPMNCSSGSCSSGARRGVHCDRPREANRSARSAVTTLEVSSPVRATRHQSADTSERFCESSIRKSIPDTRSASSCHAAISVRFRGKRRVRGGRPERIRLEEQGRLEDEPRFQFVHSTTEVQGDRSRFVCEGGREGGGLLSRRHLG